MTVTLKDIAHRVGKSVTTVSRALHDFDDVSPETKAEVRLIAEELGYIPNAAARILAKNLGFKCTVVFGVDDDGHIEAGSSKVSGLEALDDADLFFIFARFLNLPAEEMDHLVDYLERCR